jgi:chemosensory pili system protein ChpA (sensor histidine kinase/response regulator)
MELTGFANTVDEMGMVIQKISEQLRRMDGELESQIIARHIEEVSTHEGGQYQDFDPLEMDQYSSINQLSKSLAESVSDLLDFKNTLVEKSRDSESLLLQQSRIQLELQEGLMSSRLVPFSRLVPRLQRIVRQTATELGKPVELVILNAEGELDRSVLERMVAPLEHMLRNAVDHGVEPPADRVLHQKPEKGTVTLSVLREGSEVIITLQDDGRGIDVDAVRRKAIERGIIDKTTEHTDLDIKQLIFHAGLSTAAQVTQISGRGVGMDVVQSEIRQLGGVVTVDSTAGKGTCFTLRLPLTVAVTDALRVRVGDRIFAVSLSQIERIVRINTTELEQFYESHQQTYKVDGQEYRLRYLGELIGGSHTPTLYGQNIPSPLLLIKYEGQRFAVQVDQLIGSREEMVIKPVGLQLASVGSISGATILGDGSVVIILDLVALARSAGSIARMIAVPQADLKEVAISVVQKQTIMVVDDSVTVRKVTTRLLERHGYQVIQAKDGVDAMSKLEDVHPDLMLLDIEMPRMDGFEVATLVRHNPRLSYLPIIMITSRTGEKHRERAYSVGVNGYMGKPFQEQILLENISDLLLNSKAEIARNTTLA